MTFWSIFLGVLSGIVAGVIINLVVVSIIQKNSQKQSINNLKFEIEYNIKKINEFLEELTNYRIKIMQTILINTLVIFLYQKSF